MSNCRIKRERNQKVKLPNVELNECRIKREGSVSVLLRKDSFCSQSFHFEKITLGENHEIPSEKGKVSSKQSFACLYQELMPTTLALSWIVCRRIRFPHKSIRIMNKNAAIVNVAVYFVPCSSFFKVPQDVFEGSSLWNPGAYPYCMHQGCF